MHRLSRLQAPLRVNRLGVSDARVGDASRASHATVGAGTSLSTEGAIGVGVALAFVGGAIAYTFVKNDQIPAAVVTGIATLGIAPRIASSL